MHTTRNHTRISTLLLIATLAACGGQNADAKTGADSAAAALATMNVGPENVVVIQSEMVATGPIISGTLTAEREATVRAQIPGPVLSTSADEGSRVARGALLARIDDRTLRDAFLSARGATNTARSTLNLAQRELDRFTKLKEAGAISEREFETAKLNHESAESQVADAQARLTLAQKQLDDAQVRAPFAGIVSERQVNAGDIVSPGGAMFTIIDPSSMRLEGAVPAHQLSSVRIGVPVAFTVSGYPDRAFTGKVSRINPSADATTGQVQVVVSIPNTRGGLVGGLFADGRVQSERRQAPVVASNAVDLRGVRPWVLRLRDGKAEKVEVELGIRDEDSEKYEVISGIAAGDTLLIGAAQGITAGTPVRISAPNDQTTPRQ
jgi:RND family efflux transporter MFP subunit